MKSENNFKDNDLDHMWNPELKAGKPADMSDRAVISADGVNPIERDEEKELARSSRDSKEQVTDAYDATIHFPRAVPPGYLPGYPQFPGNAPMR